MLSIGAMTGGQGEYYLDLAQEDYYLNGGEPPGWWWGAGAASLKLRGLVARHELQQLLDGFSPKGEKLTQNVDRDDRRPGWDLTFSAPKSVSVLWSQAAPDARRQIQEAHLAAVKAALHYLETEAGFTRRGNAGAESERVGLLVAGFEHGTSRAGDPQLHTHCLVLNIGTRADGTTGTIASQPLYAHKMAAGAAYRVELAHELQHRLGVECKRKRSWFEVSGVPSALCEFFSKRREEIIEKLGELGLETASAAAFATLSTRKSKELVAPRSELLDAWKSQAVEHGFNPDGFATLLGKQHVPPLDRRASYFELLAETVNDLTYQVSHFSELGLTRGMLEASQGRGLDTEFIRGWLKRDLENPDLFVRLGERKGEVRYTTNDMLTNEERLLEIADTLFKRSEFYAGPRYMDEFPTLRREQQNAVIHLTEKSGGIALLSGIAGSGKTTTLNACRERWQSAGFKVIGAALAGKAAEQLQKGSGITSDTLAMLELRMRPASLKSRIKHDLRQIARAARRRKTYGFSGPLTIDSKTVLVIDEAGMVGTRQMVRILDAVHRHGGKVVLLGDAAQLQAIEAGSPFQTLWDRLGGATLKEIIRQRHERDRQLIRDLLAGDAEKVRNELAAQGRICVEETPEIAMQQLVSHWGNHRSARRQDDLILCGTNAAAAELNRRCQKDQILRGRLETSKSVELEAERLYVGDRVLFNRNDRKLGVKNGYTGTVVAIDAAKRRASVRIDDGERVDVRLDRYVHRHGEHAGECALKLGYAMTTHKAQGSTVENVYVFGNSSTQNREMFYVQLSRARSNARLYTTEAEAGQDLTLLVRQLERSVRKGMAHEVLENRSSLRSAM